VCAIVIDMTVYNNQINQSNKRELQADSVIDKRHASRSVRCVTWKNNRNRNGGGGGGGSTKVHGNVFSMDEDMESERVNDSEKFALKMILRRKNIKMNLNEKDIMLSLDSEWHTKLINT
jgi:hypothetical protein